MLDQDPTVYSIAKGPVPVSVDVLCFRGIVACAIQIEEAALRRRFTSLTKCVTRALATYC